MSVESRPRGAATSLVGAPETKLRGVDFLTGRARYVDDIVLPGTLHLAVVRSPHAHATIRRVDCEAARAEPDALLVLDGEEIAAATDPIPHRIDPAEATGPEHAVAMRPLAVGKVVYQGEPVALVVAPSRRRAQAIAALVEIDYEPLEPVVDARAALEPGAPRVYDGWPDNRAARYEYGDRALTDTAFARAARTLEGELVLQRYGTQPLEPRGYLASWDGAQRRLTFYGSSQNPHTQRFTLAQCLRLREGQLHVIVPDLGGSFGNKMHAHPEEPLVCVASMRLGRPVKWTESRAEALLIGGREQAHRWEVAFDGDGRVTGLRDRFVANIGALNATPGWGMVRLTAMTLPSGYDIPASHVVAEAVVTNKGPWAPSRGYGKEATALLLEHVFDRVAEAVGRDPADVRRINFVRPDAFPYRMASGLRIDSGNYHGALDRALTLADYRGQRARQVAARERGRLLGIGVAFEMTPEAADFPGTMTGAFETATIKVGLSGDVTVLTGVTSPGSGNDTAIAQIVADALGISPGEIDVVQGDTDRCPFGFGNSNGRSTVLGGAAAHLAARDVRESLSIVAAEMLGCPQAEVDFAGGAARHLPTGAAVALADVAYAIYTESFARAKGVEPPLEVTRTYRPGNIDHTADEQGRIQPYATFSNAVHVSTVEVDRETGTVAVLAHVTIDDCGVMINPRMVRGQMEGAVAMGLGGALFEHQPYDDQGRLLVDGFKTYLMPRVTDLPEFELGHQVTPSPFSLLGTKGAGEAGVGGAAAAVLGAVNDALRPAGVLVDHLPCSPPRILELLNQPAKKERP